jgi:hypothetical protein
MARDICVGRRRAPVFGQSHRPHNIDVNRKPFAARLDARDPERLRLRALATGRVVTLRGCL